MTFLTSLGLNRARFSLLLMVALIISGILLYVDFPKREDPEILIRTAIVDARYPGMTPERVENLIAEKIERKVREIKEVDEIATVLKTGSMRIYVTLKDEVTDLDPVWQELRDKMEEAERDVPDGTYGPFVNTDFGEVAIATIAMTAEGFSFREMEVTAKHLQRRLYTLAGVSKVEISGVQEERIWLEFDSRRLGSIGGQINTLINDLQTQNVILPAGELNAEGTSILLEASGDFKSVEEVENMLTQITGSEDFVRVKDVLKVRRGFVSPKKQPVFYNGLSALVISVQMHPGLDVQDVGADVQAMVHRFEGEQPIGYEFSFITYQPKDVTKAVNGALANVGQTFLVVFLVVLSFLGFRSGMVIASIVPFAVMFALLGMNVLDIALEQVSIAAVIISLGLLVDNGVVIVEDILRRIDEGSNRRDAALAAGSQFAVPLLVSSLTTIFAFTPFFMLVGAEGEYAFSLGAVVALTLIGSWVSAMYFLPLIAAKFLRRRRAEAPVKEIEDSENKLVYWYGRWLPKAIKRSGVVILVCYGAIFGTLQLFGLVKKEMFPASDRGEVLIYMDLPKGAHIGGTEAIARRVSNWILNSEANPEVIDHALYVGSGGPRFVLALNPEDPDPATAFFLVNTPSNKAAEAFADRAQRYLFENQPEGRFTIKRLTMGASESGIVDVKIMGPDLERLLAMGRDVETLFAQAPGIMQNQHNWGEKLIKFVIDIDQDKARRLNMSSQDLAQTLSAYFDGFEMSEFRDADQTIPIVLRSEERDRNSVGDLLDISLPDGNGRLTPLEQLAVLRPALEHSQIRRLDQVRTITISGKSTALTAEELYAYIQPELANFDLRGGFSIEIGGEIEDSKEIYGKLSGGLPFAFLLMILAVVYQFNSLRRGLVVFMTVPLALIGVPIGLVITGEPMSFFATLGLISLAGIIINNAIVLVDQIDIEITDKPFIDAIRIAGMKRLRPVLLTSITTVVGLAPLYLTGGALWSPLAVVMMFGLAFASVLTLFFVPAAYYRLLRHRYSGA